MMSDVQSPEAVLSEPQPESLEPIYLPDESATDDPIPDSVIVIKRSTVYFAVMAVGIFVVAYLIGFTMGTSTASGANALVVREAVATSIAGLLSGNVAAAPPTEDPNLRFTVNVAGSPALGPDNAPVTIVEFSDFQCPFCGQFFDRTEQALLKKYDGKVRFVFRHFPLEQIHPFARPAAEAAECANEQQKFWEYHDLLFQNQDRLTKADFIAYAGQIKLDVKAFQDCIETGKYAQKVQNDIQEAETLNITGTPTFFINGRKLVGAQPLTQFSAYIDAELAKPVGR